MNRQSNKKVKAIFANYKKHRFWSISVAVLAVVVSLTTLHFLILPAITMEKTPICGLEEHTHTSECYKEEKVLVCALPEDENHKHNESCYEIKRTLICTKQEHTHTSDCYEQSDAKADKENEKDWQASVAGAKLSGKAADDLVAVAKTQLDYKESSKNFVWNKDGDKMGYTRYGDWFGNKYADWNTMFVSFCLNYAKVPQNIIPYKASIAQWIETLKQNGLYDEAKKAKPEKGDILFLDNNEDGKADSAAIVSEVKANDKKTEIKAIEGNVKNKVKTQSYSLKDNAVKGFGKISRAQTFALADAKASSHTQQGTYWKQVRSMSELKAFDTVMVVSVEGNYALTNNKGNTNLTNKTPVQVNPVKGNPDYYTIDKTPVNTQWTYTSGALGNAFNYRLDPQYTNELFVANNYAATLKFGPSGDPNLTGNPNPTGCWNLSSYDSYYGYRYYLDNDGGEFYGSTYAYSGKDKISDMLILKKVDTTLTIPDDAQPRPEIGGEPGSAIKPNYPAYINTTGALSGSMKYLGADGEYRSDPSTSKIESKFGYHTPTAGQTDFDAQKVDDGKTLTDKSVIYGKDDYKAFGKYEADEFSVTLSALGQVFSESSKVEKLPIDVLFVLDLSGSMNSAYGGETRSRAEILVEAMNKTLEKILSSNPKNRVAAVGYNSTVTELLPLGRPAKNARGEYFRFLEQTGGEYYTEHKINIVDGNKTVTCHYGTYTQLGIAKGVEVMQRNKDTTVPLTIDGKTVNYPRQPIIILVSDGEPTHCTSHYMNVVNSPYYGDGIGDHGQSTTSVTNPKGVLGYYTILSANYYKRMLGIHYDNPSSMYTVAFGMKEMSNEHALDAAATKHYCSTVMHPTEANINHLPQVVNNYKDDIEQTLYDLLKGTYKNKTIKIGSNFDLVNIGKPHTVVPILKENPYRGNYNYANKAFLENEGVDGLNAAFDEILNLNAITVHDQAYETVNHTPIKITDPIGDGMEIHGDPVLRLNGKNYQPTGKPVRNGVQYYEYKYGSVPMDNFSTKKVLLDNIQVKVTKDSSGKQLVTMDIPDNTLPIYAADRTSSFYYEALPVRLIYKVGLSQKSKTAVENLAPGQTLTYYTNNYQGAEHAKALVSPLPNNTYYNSGNWKQNINKLSNPTETDSYSLIVGGQPTNVTDMLGNNGKLVFTKPAPKKTLSVQKKWLDYNGQETTEKLPENITATLYRTYTDKGGKSVREDVVDFTLNAQNGWKKTFTYAELKETPGRDYLYYVNEQQVEGYKVSYKDDGVSQNTPETPILITNRYKFGDLILPSTGGPGTIILSVIGIALMASAIGYGYVLMRRKKKSNCK